MFDSFLLFTFTDRDGLKCYELSVLSSGDGVLTELIISLVSSSMKSICVSGKMKGMIRSEVGWWLNVENHESLYSFMVNFNVFRIRLFLEC